MAFAALITTLVVVRAQSPTSSTETSSAARTARPSRAVKRTPGGDPDLEGVWNYGTMTPLERPANWAGKETLSETEAVAYEQQTIARRSTANNTAGPDWWEPENNVLKNRRTALIVDPPDGRLPPAVPSPDGRGRGGRGGGRGAGGAYDNPEQLGLQDRCIAWGAAGPPYQPTVYNNNVEIVQTKDYVVLLSEMIHVARIVPTDGRPHGTARTWYGDSRGHYEDGTLVIDTINFNGRLNFRNTGENLHLIERFTRTGDATLSYEYTVDAPKTWTRPWTARLEMTKKDGLIYEFSCHEGNAISMLGTLQGARMEEQRQPAR
jgi:hypothetical protein